MVVCCVGDCGSRVCVGSSECLWSVVAYLCHRDSVT